MQLHRAREQFEAAGLRVALIGQATPRDAARFRERLHIDLPILVDEQRITYKAIGARRGGVGELVGPKVVAKGLLASARNRVHQGMTVGSSTQLGGAVVVKPGGEIAYMHLARDASDNVSPEDLLAAVR